jgi:hypothetical protein
MIFSCSIGEPGHPCVTMSGKAFFMSSTDVDEMDVEPIDLGDELGSVQSRLDLAPVVVCGPVVASFCMNSS